MISIKLIDGKILNVPVNSTVGEVASKISTSLRKKTLAALVDGTMTDLTSKLNKDCTLELITTDSPLAFAILNHSTAHLLAAAIKSLYKEVSFGVGPSTEEGFYYDINCGDKQIQEEDLIKIEKEMVRIASSGAQFEKIVVSKDEANSMFAHDKYKLELISEITNTITVYKLGDFYDLCRGVHLEKASIIKNFKLLTIAGAYWRGNANNDQLQRIYGTSHFTKDALNEYLALLTMRKEYDHRKLGKDLNMFMFSPLIGQGLPIWLPNGMKVRKTLQDYIYKLEQRYGYEHVATPVLGTLQLYETSGHWGHYRENMFAPIICDNETLVLRPMSCPHHVAIYKHFLHSYRDLPVRLAEEVLQHRYEASGALTGMERVRAMNLTDSHVFCRPDQIIEEFTHALSLISRVIDDLGIKVDYYCLSLRDPSNKDKYYDDDKMWDKAESMLKLALDDAAINYRCEIGEAAFYGPKLDIQVKTMLGHEITLSTIQLDFLLPERFDLTYIDKEGQKSRPVMIHRGLIGTYERFLAILLENYKGALPLWLAPTQVIVLPVANEFHLAYCQKLSELFFDLEIRHAIDSREEKLGYRLREAQIQKIPFQLVIGDNEVASNLVTYRRYGETAQTTVKVNEFEKLLLDEIRKKKK